MEGKKKELTKEEIKDWRDKLIVLLKTKTNRIILAKYPYYKQINALADLEEKEKVFSWIKKQIEWCSKLENKIKRTKKEENFLEIQEQINVR